MLEFDHQDPSKCELARTITEIREMLRIQLIPNSDDHMDGIDNWFSTISDIVLGNIDIYADNNGYTKTDKPYWKTNRIRYYDEQRKQGDL